MTFLFCLGTHRTNRLDLSFCFDLGAAQQHHRCLLCRSCSRPDNKLTSGEGASLYDVHKWDRKCKIACIPKIESNTAVERIHNHANVICFVASLFELLISSRCPFRAVEATCLPRSFCLLKTQRRLWQGSEEFFTVLVSMVTFWTLTLH